MCPLALTDELRSQSFSCYARLQVGRCSDYMHALTRAQDVAGEDERALSLHALMLPTMVDGARGGRWRQQERDRTLGVLHPSLTQCDYPAGRTVADGRLPCTRDYLRTQVQRLSVEALGQRISATATK